MNETEMAKRLTRFESRKLLFDLMSQELDRAYDKHGDLPWGRHEFYGILKEEVDELWDCIKANVPQDELMAELIQVAAMCYRYAETGPR